MRKKAIITITSRQDNIEDSAIEVVTPGEFYKEQDNYYAVYDETEISGMQGTKTTLKVAPEKFSLIRTGTTIAEMNFKQNTKELTMYNTPYGILEMKIDTKKLTIDLNDNGGEVLVNYDLIIAGERPQNTILKINIRA